MTISKQKDYLDSVYPTNDKLQGKEVNSLIKSAILICSSYAYHRGIIPPEGFKMVRIYESKNNPVFDSSYPKAKKHLEALQGIASSLEEKKIKQVFFALCEENNPESIVEVMRFEFDYTEAAMNVLLPNTTNVRVSTKWDFAEDLCEVLKRVRLVSSLLSELPKNLKPFVGIYFLKEPEELPKDFKYHEKYDLDKIKTLPLARIPCTAQNIAMNVEIRSKYFEAPIGDVQQDIANGLFVEDASQGTSSNFSTQSKQSQQQRSIESSEKEKSTNNDDDVINDSFLKDLEEPENRREERMILPHESDEHELSNLFNNAPKDDENRETFSFDGNTFKKRSYSSANLLFDSPQVEPQLKKTCSA